MEDTKKRELIRELLATDTSERLKILHEIADAVCRQSRWIIDLQDSMLRLVENEQDESLRQLHIKLAAARKLSYQVIGILGEIAHD